MKSQTFSDQDVLDRIAAQSRASATTGPNAGAAPPQHPGADLLYEYAAGEADEQAAQAVRAHLAVCSRCAREALRVMAAMDALEAEAVAWADSADAPLEPAVSPPSPGAAVARAANSLKEHALLWLSELWQPQWAGQLVTADDIPGQQHTFTSDHGDIHLSCHWHDDIPGEPAVLTITWQADLIEAERLWLRFLNPATQSLRQEIFLGTRAAGEEHFTIQDVNFDFMREEWAIALALEAAA